MGWALAITCRFIYSIWKRHDCRTEYPTDVLDFYLYSCILVLIFLEAGYIYLNNLMCLKLYEANLIIAQRNFWKSHYCYTIFTYNTALYYNNSLLSRTSSRWLDSAIYSIYKRIIVWVSSSSGFAFWELQLLRFVLFSWHVTAVYIRSSRASATHDFVYIYIYVYRTSWAVENVRKCLASYFCWGAAVCCCNDDSKHYRYTYTRDFFYIFRFFFYSVYQELSTRLINRKSIHDQKPMKFF